MNDTTRKDLDPELKDYVDRKLKALADQLILRFEHQILSLSGNVPPSSPPQLKASTDGKSKIKGDDKVGSTVSKNDGSARMDVPFTTNPSPVDGVETTQPKFDFTKHRAVEKNAGSVNPKLSKSPLKVGKSKDVSIASNAPSDPTPRNEVMTDNPNLTVSGDNGRFVYQPKGKDKNDKLSSDTAAETKPNNGNVKLPEPKLRSDSVAAFLSRAKDSAPETDKTKSSSDSDKTVSGKVTPALSWAEEMENDDLVKSGATTSKTVEETEVTEVIIPEDEKTEEGEKKKRKTRRGKRKAKPTKGESDDKDKPAVE